MAEQAPKSTEQQTETETKSRETKKNKMSKAELVRARIKGDAGGKRVGAFIFAGYAVFMAFFIPLQLLVTGDERSPVLRGSFNGEENPDPLWLRLSFALVWIAAMAGYVVTYVGFGLTAGAAEGACQAAEKRIAGGQAEALAVSNSSSAISLKEASVLSVLQEAGVLSSAPAPAPDSTTSNSKLRFC